MNVSEVSRKLNITQQELKNILPVLGFSIGQRAIKIPDHQVDKIMAAYKNYLRKKEQEEREGKITEIKKGDTVATEKIAYLPPQLTVRELSDRLNLPVAKVMAEMMKGGFLATINQTIDYDTGAIIAGDLGYKVSREEAGKETAAQSSKDAETLAALLKTDETKQEQMPSRPPVVVVMGHVDHGKTSLLDAIRETNVAGGESGGITQHIGAYQVAVKSKDSKEERMVTVLDTPGHEAFKAMRGRGGRAADVAVLVVAADDGVQPQTIESIEIIQQEKLPFVVAINKIDKPEADINRVKQDLSNLNLVPEDWGGTVICVPLSAKSKQGIPELLEMVLLVADLTKLTADPDRPAAGTIIESHVDKGEGPVATVLVQTGTLRIGDWVAVGNVPGKVKALKDFMGKPVVEAKPSTPVKILGLKSVPAVGGVLQVIDDKKKIKEMINEFEEERAKIITTVEETSDTELGVMVKADVVGSVEALSSALVNLKEVPRGKIKVVRKGLGRITAAEALEAEALKVPIFGFRVDLTQDAETLAKEKGIIIIRSDVIYSLLDEATRLLKEKVEPEIVRREIGKLKVIVIFRTQAHSMIVGGQVLDGSVKPKTNAKVIRNKQLVGRETVESVQIGREAIGEVTVGGECGLKITGEPIVQVGDILEIYQEEKR
ncbi:MAG: translation initiation factor IF-2 [bacterium]